MTLVGKAGGEGKSFLLSPLAEVFGSEYVQTTPQSGQFPLLGLETKKAVFLDEWEFDRYSPLSWSTQLMWFDNKAICITRPQNNCNGHLIYRGTSPIITANLKNVGPIHERAQAAAAEGKSSDDTMMMRRLRCSSLYREVANSGGRCGSSVWMLLVPDDSRLRTPGGTLLRESCSLDLMFCMLDLVVARR